MSEVTYLFNLHLQKPLGDTLSLLRIYQMFAFSFSSFCLSGSLLFAFLPAFKLWMKFLAQISKLWNTEYRIPMTKNVCGVFLLTSVGFGSGPKGLICPTGIMNKQYQHRATVLGSVCQVLARAGTNSDTVRGTHLLKRSYAKLFATITFYLLMSIPAKIPSCDMKRNTHGVC